MRTGVVGAGEWGSEVSFGVARVSLASCDQRSVVSRLPQHRIKFVGSRITNGMLKFANDGLRSNGRLS